jgi:hypothetical protein
VAPGQWHRDRAGEVQREFQGSLEGDRSLEPQDYSMTWIIISIPLMLVAIAIAVLPVLLMSVSEARRGFELPGHQRTTPGVAIEAGVFNRTIEDEAKAA